MAWGSALTTIARATCDEPPVMGDNGATHYFRIDWFTLDCLNHTENAMTQERYFKAAKLCVKVQMQTVKIA